VDTNTDYPGLERLFPGLIY